MHQAQKKVIIGMSGGVDSSVAAYLLKSQGYDVIGVHMKYWNEQDDIDINEQGIVSHISGRSNKCCSLESVEDARQVAMKIGIPIYVVDFKTEFKKRIVDYYIEQFEMGNTPNPCVICNRDVKFGLLMDYATKLGVDYVSTGHYARVSKVDDYYHLLKAVDETKDQSYFLCLLSQTQLSKIILPLGDMSKDNVRKIATDQGLITARKHDSQDLCFVHEDYRSFLKKYLNNIKKGPITLSDGRVIGEHKGLPLYTLGQRKGVETKLNVPLYVLSKNLESNTLVVGNVDDYNSNEILIRNFNKIGFSTYQNDTDGVALRYQGKISPIMQMTNINNNDVQLKLTVSTTGATPGQFAVIYNKDRCIGGGIIG